MNGGPTFGILLLLQNSLDILVREGADHPNLLCRQFFQLLDRAIDIVILSTNLREEGD